MPANLKLAPSRTETLNIAVTTDCSRCSKSSIMIVSPKHHMERLILMQQHGLSPDYPYDQRSKSGQLVWDVWSVIKYLIKRASVIYPPLHFPPILKHAVLRRYARRFRLATFVETGTWKGDAVGRMLGVSKHIYSIEFQPFLAQKAKERFADYSFVDIRQGDSAIILPQILDEIREPTLFWLDGHFPPGASENCCPTFTELKSILLNPEKGHVILIDDAHDFRGKSGYPTINEVIECVADSRPDLSVTVKNDILRIVPN